MNGLSVFLHSFRLISVWKEKRRNGYFHLATSETLGLPLVLGQFGGKAGREEAWMMLDTCM